MTCGLLFSLFCYPNVGFKSLCLVLIDQELRIFTVPCTYGLLLRLLGILPYFLNLTLLPTL